MNKILSGFFWAQRRPPVAKKTLITEKADGGLVFPDAMTYYVAAVATRIYNWFHHRDTKLWIHLEYSFCKYPLTTLPWIPVSTMPKMSLSVLLVAQSFRRTYSPHAKFFLADSPLTPTVDNLTLSVPALFLLVPFSLMVNLLNYII